LLLRLDAHRQVLASLPVDLAALGVVVDEVATVAVLLAVEVRLGQDAVGEEVVVGELEDEPESGLVEVLHADVDQVAQRRLVLLHDDLLERDVVLHRRQPKLGDTLDGAGRLGLLVLLVVALGGLGILGEGRLAGLDFGLGGLGAAVDDDGSPLVERGELLEVLLLKLEHVLLELGLELAVLLLDALEAGDAAANIGWQVLDVAGRAADELVELVLHQGDHGRVAGNGAAEACDVDVVLWRGQFLHGGEVWGRADLRRCWRHWGPGRARRLGRRWQGCFGAFWAVSGGLGVC
jgi:hypothetical protein